MILSPGFLPKWLENNWPLKSGTYLKVPNSLWVLLLLLLFWGKEGTSPEEQQLMEGNDILTVTRPTMIMDGRKNNHRVCYKSN